MTHKTGITPRPAGRRLCCSRIRHAAIVFLTTTVVRVFQRIDAVFANVPEHYREVELGHEAAAFGGEPTSTTGSVAKCCEIAPSASLSLSQRISTHFVLRSLHAECQRKSSL